MILINSSRNTFKRWLLNNEFLALLIALCLFLFLPSFFKNVALKNTFIYGLLIFLLAAGVFELRHRTKTFYAGVVLAVLVIVFNSISFSPKNDVLFLVRMGSLFLFFLVLTIFVLYRLTISRRINSNIIYCAVCGYLLLGLLGGLGFRLIHHFYENSFYMSGGHEPKVDDFTYLSFVTLATLGYGDISPISPPAKVVSIFLSVAGQMYLVVVIGIIIGKFNYYGHRK